MEELTLATLDNHIQLDMVVVCMVYKPGCPWCSALRPIVDTLSKLYVGRVTVGQINILAFPALRERFSIKTVPFLAFFKEGHLTKVLQGNESERTQSKLASHIEACLG